MKLNTSIKYMDYFIPQSNINMEDVLFKNKNHKLLVGRKYDDYVKEFKEQTGLDKISTFTLDDNLPDIVTNMVEKMFEITGIDANQIRYLVCGNPSLMEDNVSIVHYIHKKFNLTNATILPIFQPCASSIITMGLADKLLNPNEKEFILVLSARKSPDIQNRFLGFTIMGDGLSLVLIENKPGKINITNWRTFNNGECSYEKLNSFNINSNLTQLSINIIRDGVLFIQRALEELNANIHEFNKMIHPNTNCQVWNSIYSNLLAVNASMFYTKNISNGGHINDVDLIRNMKDYIENVNGTSCNSKILVYAIDLVISLDVNHHLLTIDLQI